MKPITKVRTALMLAVLTAAPCLVAAEKAGPKRTKKPRTSTESGMVVVRDAETGELRAPTAKEFRFLEEVELSIDQSSEGVRIETRANGSKIAHLDGRFMSLAVARVGKDGKLQHTCASDPKAAVEFLSGSTADHTHAAPVLEEK